MGFNSGFKGLMCVMLYSTGWFQAYFAAISIFRNRFLSPATKVLLYKTLIRPVVTWSGNVDDDEEGRTSSAIIFRKDNI